MGTAKDTLGLPIPFITNKGCCSWAQSQMSVCYWKLYCQMQCHNCSAAQKASDEDADGLWLRYFLQSAKVMLTWNLWTSKGVTSAYPKLLIFLIKIYLGLVNGCQGVVKKICCNQTSNSKKGDLPAIVFFQCNGYSGRIILLSTETQVLQHRDGTELIPLGFQSYKLLHGGKTGQENPYLISASFSLGLGNYYSQELRFDLGEGNH